MLKSTRSKWNGTVANSKTALYKTLPFIGPIVTLELRTSHASGGAPRLKTIAQALRKGLVKQKVNASETACHRRLLPLHPPDYRA